MSTFIRVLIFVLVFSFGSIEGGAHGAPLLDREEVEAWADEYYGRAVAEKRSAAITLSVVQDGEVLLQKGYGYHDYQTKQPMDPETSAATVGSITKTFVATAVAQLVDRGMIGSLDDPANKYLKRVQLPGTWGQQVTLSHLLNHRAGFADVDFGFLDKTAKDATIPLTPKEIMRFMPDIVMEPGGRAAYSNWSFSLLGFIVEDVTGERLDSYLKRNIFDPLSMTHTSLIYGKHADNLSQWYLFTKTGEAVPQPHLLPHPWISPAGTIASTAGDMARYMNAHIYKGEDGGFPLLSKKMFDTLHKESFRNSAISFGFGHTFWTDRVNGEMSIEHGGGTPAFENIMFMIPALKVGFYVGAMQSGLVPWEKYSEEELKGDVMVKNPPDGFALRESFVARFFNREPIFETGPKSDLSKLVGSYYHNRRPFNTIEILGQGFNPAAVLSISLDDGGDAIRMSGNGPFREIGNGVFENISGEDNLLDPYNMDHFNPPFIAFNLSEEGEVIDFVPGFAERTWLPVSSIFNPQTMVKGFLLFSVIAVSGCLLFLWPVGSRLRNPANWLGVLLTLAVITIPYSVIGGYAQGDSMVAQMAVGEKGRLWIMVAAANAILLLACLMLWQCFTIMARKSHRTVAWVNVGNKVHIILVTVAALVLVLALAHFNFIGINMPG